MMPIKCLATSAPGLDGKGNSMTGLGDLAKQIGDMLGKLMQGGGGGGGEGGAPPPTTPQQTCPTGMHVVSSPSTDPCAQYVPNSTLATSSVDANSQALLDLLAQGGSTTTFGGTGTGTGGNPSTTTTVNNTDLTPIAHVIGTFQAPNTQTATVTPGLSGAIQTDGSGATFIATNVQDTTETSSFFGGDGVGGFVGTLVGSWCHSRPWAIGFIASIIPPSFFDGLCSSNGFTVGNAAPTAAVNTATTGTNVTYTNHTAPVLTQSPVQKLPAKSTVKQVLQSSLPFVTPRVDIWAVPSSVPLGARAEIFWNSENVLSCTVASPDGSFHQTSLSGASATVPLTGPTTFTMSCLDTQQNPVTDYVTVNIGG